VKLVFRWRGDDVIRASARRDTVLALLAICEPGIAALISRPERSNAG